MNNKIGCDVVKKSRHIILSGIFILVFFCQDVRMFFRPNRRQVIRNS